MSLLLPQRAGVERDGRYARRTRRQCNLLAQPDGPAERRNRMGPAARALDLGPPHFVAEHKEVRDAAVVEAERDAGVDRVQQRALAFDPEQLAASRPPLDHEP